MDKRLIFTKRQKELLKELKKELVKLEGKGGCTVCNLLDTYDYGCNDKIEIFFCGTDNRGGREISSYKQCRKLLRNCSVDVGKTGYNDVLCLLENNQYVKDRIAVSFRKIFKERKKRELQDALGEDGIRLQELKALYKQYCKARLELEEELERFRSSGNESVVDIILEDLAANSKEIASIRSESIRLGRAVAKKKREFLEGCKSE